MRVSRSATLGWMALVVTATSCLAATSSSKGKKGGLQLEDFTTSILTSEAKSSKRSSSKYKSASYKTSAKKKKRKKEHVKESKQKTMKLHKSKGRKGKKSSDEPTTAVTAAPTPTPVPQTTCFEENGELRRAVLSYNAGDDTIMSTYGANISDWCVGRVTNFDFIFSGVTRFNEPLNAWDVSAATSMDFM